MFPDLVFNVLRLKVKGKLKLTWKRYAEVECVKAGLNRVDELCLSLWIVTIDHIATWLR